MNIPPVILKASRKHTASLVFLHGLGDTGFGWAGALNTIRPKYMKIICPTAPMQPVTLNGGASMPAWYDIISLDERDSNREDREGVDWAVNYLLNVVKGEEMEGIPNNRIIIGGFSQGGAIALRSCLSSPHDFGGCLALSCYLPGDVESLKRESQVTTPIFQAHGEEDRVVSYKRGQLTSSVVQKLAKAHRFVSYQDMGHEAIQEELDDIKQFIHDQLGDD